MKNISLIPKYIIIIISFLFMGLSAQDEATEEVTTDAVTEEVAPISEDDAVTEEVAPAPEGDTAEEVVETEAVAEEVVLADAVEEESTSSGFTVGLAPSIGLVSGETFTNVPVGATLVITTPYGFKLGPLDFTISAALGGYAGEFEGDSFNPSIMGVGGNLVLANLVFAEGHAGKIGDGMGVRGFAGVSLEYLMKKALNLPVNILIGGEGFISNDMAGVGNASGLGGLGVRLDYDL